MPHVLIVFWTKGDIALKGDQLQRHIAADDRGGRADNTALVKQVENSRDDELMWGHTEPSFSTCLLTSFIEATRELLYELGWEGDRLR